MENRMHLTPRLRAIMGLVPQGTSFADIGTDHALLPAALLRRGKIDSAIASDIRKGPLESAARTAEQFGLSDRISLRLGPGLTTVRPEEAETIAIAGMGGETMIEILETDPWALDGSHLLLLQAMTGQAELRQYLAAKGCRMEKEILCREGKRMYTIMQARGGGEPEQKTPAECCLSEELCRDPLAAEYIAGRLRREEKICRALETAERQKPEEYALHRDSAAVMRRALAELEKGRDV